MLFGSFFTSTPKPVEPVIDYKTDKATLCTQGEMEEPQESLLTLGEAAYYSRRSPDKETPNEDALAIFTPTEQSVVLVVADGVGGRKGGEEAAKIIIESFQKCLREFERQQARLGEVSESTGSIILRTAILNSIETANEEIIKLGTGAASTIAVAEIQNQTIRTYHVGDSPIMLVGQRGKIKLRTVAHSPVGFAQEAGMLEASEAMHHSERHIVFNVVGSNEMWIEMGSPIEMAPRDTLIVSSDGLADNLLESEIVELIRKGPLLESLKKLSFRSRRRMCRPRAGIPSKPDDNSIIVYRRAKKRPAPPVSEPSGGLTVSTTAASSVAKASSCSLVESCEPEENGSQNSSCSS